MPSTTHQLEEPGRLPPQVRASRPAGFFSRLEAFVIDLVILSILQFVSSAFLRSIIQFFRFTKLVAYLRDLLEIQALRNRAKTDLYFLIKGVLGYRDLSPNLHGHLCAWLERTNKEQFRCILLPRAHSKSTVVTIALNVQRVLNNPNIRILIAHESHFGAQRFLQEIQSHFLTNPKLQALFPELIPDPKVQRINISELEIPRAGHWAEPTFDTLGVGARSQGRHYDHITLDDIYGDKARDSQLPPVRRDHMLTEPSKGLSGRLQLPKVSYAFLLLFSVMGI